MESSSWLCFSILHNTKILQRGLLLVWICGVFFIGVSFYETQKLPALLEEQITTKKPGPYSLAFGDLSFPKTTIFTAPKPFVGSTGKAQALAVRSWLGLSKNIEVVLFSQDPSVLSFADLFGSRVSVEANIDFTFLGTPFFHSMVARSRTTSSNISVLIDPGTILLSNFLTTLKYAHKLDADWLLVASPRNVSDFPFHLDSYGRNWLACDGKPVGTQKGVPVIKCTHRPTSISFDDCHFGTECFQKVTKVKSRVVLQILKLRYNVLLSDMDVYWFKNPLPYLNSFGSGVLVVQSDEYNSTGPINLPRRLNSGFYYARSDNTTIAALGKVVRHAANSNLSEQPSFYDTLCGEDGSHRLGDDRCLEPETGLVVQFLNRNLFPNGAYLDLWAKKDTTKACAEMGCLVIHNNWISGRKKKVERQVSSGLWSYDVTTRMCFQPWRKTWTASYFR